MHSKWAKTVISDNSPHNTGMHTDTQCQLTFAVVSIDAVSPTELQPEDTVAPRRPLVEVCGRDCPVLGCTLK